MAQAPEDLRPWILGALPLPGPGPGWAWRSWLFRGEPLTFYGRFT